jgi:hypothetical protein
MPKLRSTAALPMLAAAGVVVLNAAAADQYCIWHEYSVTCDNPIAPGPEFPHAFEQPAATSGLPAVVMWSVGFGNI